MNVIKNDKKKMPGIKIEWFMIGALLFCYFAYSISGIYGFEMLPDEFGYWTYAAMLSGYDWSDIVSIGSYYSFGYTLILYPIFRTFQNPVIAYRAAVTVNFLLLGLSLVMLTKLVEHIRPLWKKKTVYIAAIAVCYPTWLYYSRMTMTEIVVMSMYLVICLLMYLYLENSKPGVLLLLILSLVYIYTVHMRTVGILIAAVIVLSASVLWRLRSGEKRKGIRLVIAVSIGVFLLLAANELKQFISQNVYTQAAETMFAYNDYSGQMGKVRAIFTIEGIRNLAISLIGKILYLGLASFGLFYWGIAFCIQRVIKEEKIEKRLFYVFVLLATVGEIGITAIYTSGVGGRIDGLTYGRYNEQILPVLIAFGCIAVMEAKGTVRQLVIIAVSHLPALGLIIYIIQKYQQTNIHACMIVGISYLYDKERFESVSFHIGAYLAGTILMIVITWLLRMSAKKKIELFLVGIVVIELALGMRLAHIFSKDTQLGNFRDIQIIELIQEKQENYERLLYLQEGNRCMVDNLQFRLRDEKIWLEYDKEQLAETDFIITDYQYSGIEELKQKYTNWRIMGHFAIFYN